MLIFVGYLYSWGAYKCMVKYESSNGSLLQWRPVAARRWSPLNFAWPWLVRRSVAAITQQFNSHSSRGFCSCPAMILLRSACWTCRLWFGPSLIATQLRAPLLFIIIPGPGGLFNWYPACPAANPTIASAVRLIESAQMIGCLYSWGAYFCMGAYIREVLVRTEMGAYI